MSFQPLQPGFSQSLLGTVEPTKLLDVDESDIDQPEESKDLIERRFRGSRPDSSSLPYTISLIIISAFIFVAIVSIYDVFRNIINNHYADLALTDPRANNTQEDIIRTEIANQEALFSRIFFAVFAVITALVFIGFIIFLLLNRSS